MTEPLAPLKVAAEPFLGFEPPADCREGIETNLALLASHTKILLDHLASEAGKD